MPRRHDHALATFVTRAWVVTSPGGGGGDVRHYQPHRRPVQQETPSLAHTEDYLVKIYDPVANKVVREFRRPYERVKREPLTESEKKGGVIINGKHYTRPERKYQNDVKNVLTRDGRDLGRDFDARTRPRAFSSTSSTAKASTGIASGSSSPSRRWAASCRRANAPSTANSSGSSSGPRTRRSPSRNTGS